MKKVAIIIVAALAYAAIMAYLAWPAPLPQEDHNGVVACDNSGAKDTKTRTHNCNCERAQKDHCDADGVKSPKGSCAMYCKPDACDCTGPCVPS